MLYKNDEINSLQGRAMRNIKNIFKVDAGWKYYDRQYFICQASKVLHLSADFSLIQKFIFIFLSNLIHYKQCLKCPCLLPAHYLPFSFYSVLTVLYLLALIYMISMRNLNWL